MKERGNRLLRMADRALGIPLVWTLGAIRKRRRVPKDIGVIGILMLGVIGDTLLAVSLARALKERSANVRLVALVTKANAGVIDLVEGVDETMIVPVSHPLQALRIVRSRKFDVLIDSSPWPRIGAFLTVASRSRYTIGFRTPHQYRHYGYDAVVNHANSRHELENFRQLLTPLGFSTGVSPVIRHEMRAALPKLAGVQYVVFHPWASGFRSGLREWPTQRWVELARGLDDWALDIVITGGRGDRESAERLAAAIDRPARVKVFAGATNLAELTRILANAKAVVSVNTGTMHISAVLNQPTVALHGPTNPLRWGPTGDRSVVVGPGPAQGGAYLDLGFEYPRNPEDCMSKITVAEVLNPLKVMLGRSNRQEGACRYDTDPTHS